MDILAKGAACLRCRKRKQRCDGLKPFCTRCQKCPYKCIYASGLARRQSLTTLLEARALELELTVHKLALLPKYDLSSASDKLLARIQRLEHAARSEQTPIAIHQSDLLEDGPLSRQRTLVDHQLDSYEWLGFGELPPAASFHLVEMFLQDRTQFYVFIDATSFLHNASLPESHQDSIHPCLLNACYLGACSRSGSGLRFLEPYFLRRTRHFLEHSLMYADRITHFIWASLILGCYLARRRRLGEYFSVIGAATHIAIACGLSPRRVDTGNQINQHHSAAYYPLPPPKDDAEANDRIRLAYSVYLMDQVVPVLGGPPPSFPYDDRWAMAPKDASLRYPYGKGM